MPLRRPDRLAAARMPFGTANPLVAGPAMTEPAPGKTQTRPFHTVAQVAERWQCSEKTVRRLVERGELIAHRFGSQIRISEADLTAYERVNRHAV